MRKKYLSALLFGALLFASAGTFTSCKDYDDDINGLRTEITDLKSTVTELQNAVENGKYVTAVSNSGNTITFTFSDGSTTPITLEDEKGSVVTVNEDGVLCIDGEPTDIKAATAEPDGEATKCQVIIGEDNCWQVLQEDGTYKTTNIPVSGVNVSGSEAEGYTLTIFNAAGDPTIVKLPSAASAISEIILAGDDQAAISLSLSSTEFVLGQNISSFDGSAFRKGWKGAKTLPENDSYIVRPDIDAKTIKMRVNPVDVDASVVNFKLTNSLNQDLEGVTLNAIPENDAPAAGTPDGRAAAKGGLYKMAMEDLILANEDAWNDFDNAFSVTTGSVNFALNPNATVRSAYRIQVSDGTDYTALTNISIKGVTGSNITTTGNVTLDKGKTYTIVPGNGAIYDIMISADDEAVNNYGLTFDPATSSFTIGRDVDTSTSGKFTLNVTTVDVLGNVKDFTYNVELSEKVVDSILYDAVSYGVQSTNKVFGIDLSDMKESMTAEELNTWKTRVDFSKTSYKLYKEFKDGKVATEISGQIGTSSLLEGFITETINKDASSNVSSKDKANYISMLVDDSQANSNVKLFTTYYLEVIFNNGTSEELNRIIVPVQFTAPTVAEQFKVKSGLEKDGVVYGFLSDAVTSGNNPAYTITDAFASSDANATFSVTDDLIDDMDNVKSSAEFKILSNGDDVAFKDAVPNEADKTQDAYGKAFTLKAENAKYKATNWEYPDESKYTDYKFKMMLLSPIFDGKFSTSTGDALEVIGGADFKIVNSQLNTVDYNNTKFNMLPDVISTPTAGSQEFSDSRIAKVEVADYPGYFTETKVVVAAEDKDGNVVEGYIFGKAASVATDTDPLNLTVTVTDIFGYKKTVKIPVIIKANRTE